MSDTHMNGATEHGPGAHMRSPEMRAAVSARTKMMWMTRRDELLPKIIVNAAKARAVQSANAARRRAMKAKFADPAWKAQAVAKMQAGRTAKIKKRSFFGRIASALGL